MQDGNHRAQARAVPKGKKQNQGDREYRKTTTNSIPGGFHTGGEGS